MRSVAARTTSALLALLLAAPPACAVRYRIDTFAGGGPGPDLGDGGPATEAALDAPTGLARDRRGNVYVTDHNNARVRRIYARGGTRLITTLAGTGERGSDGDSGPATAARLVQPTGVSVTRKGEVLVTDAGTDREGNAVRRIDRRGIIHAFAAGGTAAPGNSGDGGPARNARLRTPLRTAVSRRGDVYIVELNNHRVRVVRTASGNIEPYAGTGTAGDAGDEGSALDALLRNPAGLALTRDGTLYIADFGNHRIRVVTPDGVIHALAGTGVPTGSIDGPGGDPRDDRIEGGAAREATFSKPTGIALDHDGALLVADQGNSVIRRIARDASRRLSPDSVVTTIVGSGVAGFAGDGGDASLAQLLIPTEVLPIGRGRLLIADRGNQRVRIAVPLTALCAKSCSDGNPRTIDECTPEAGCTHTPREAAAAR
jgi:sugar lactone lactonase YvrE